MVLTRGIEHTHIRFAISSLKDRGLFYDGSSDMGRLSNEWKKYFESKKIPASKVVFMEQVHGSRIVEVRSEEHGAVVPFADSLLTHEPGIFLAVKTADCVPILLYDATLNCIAAVHAGWKGTRVEVARKTVEAMMQDGSNAADIHAILGPSIGSCCYNVTDTKDDRIETLEKRFGENAVKRRDKKVFLDIHEANKTLLLESGIDPSHIVNVHDCTSCGVVAYPSHYKDKSHERLISVIGIAQ